MEGKIAASVNEQIAQMKAYTAQLRLLAPRLSVLEELPYPFSVCVTSNKVILSYSAKTFRDVTPILEEIEGLLEIEFDSTHDEPNYNWREFTSSDLPGFRVDVSIYPDEDDATCQRVKVGVVEQAVYEFRCD